MRKRVWLSYLLALVLLMSALPAFAAGNAEEKSWDINGEVLYGIHAANSGYFLAVSGELDRAFGDVAILSADFFLPDDLDGTWSIERLGGDAVEVELRAADGSESVNGPIALLMLRAGEPGDEASFQVRFVSDALKNPLSKLFHVNVLAADEFPTDYVYEKTEHTVVAERDFELNGGKVLPEGAGDIVAFRWDPGAIEEVGGWVEVVHETGAIRGWIPEPGVYELPVTAILNPVGDEKTIVHTITVTEYLPEFEIDMEYDQMDLVIDEGADEWDLMNVRPRDSYKREDDRFEWSWAQLAGEVMPLEFDDAESSDSYVRIMGIEDEEGNRAPIAEGEYQYSITLKDVTRDETVSATFALTIRYKQKGEVQLEDIDYPSLKQASRVTLKAGKTLNLGKPKLYPSDTTIAPDTRYGIWVEDIDWELEHRMIIEDQLTGQHKLVGLEEGEFEVHAYVNMFDNSWGAEQVFTLVVEPAAKPVESVTISPAGTWEDPVKVPVGGQLKLKASVLPKNASIKSVTWVSQNDLEIIVDKKGVVKSDVLWTMGEIYAYANDGTNLMDTVVVQFVLPEVTKVSIPKKLSLKVGETKALTAALKPKNLPEERLELIWMSDNAEVVDVTRFGITGELTAMKPGKATIYAYPRSDVEGGINKKVYGKCVVTVK